MKDLMDWMPLLNVPTLLAVIALYIKMEVRLVKLEGHKERVEIHLGFNERRTDHGN